MKMNGQITSYVEKDSEQNLLRDCALCPRKCHVNRLAGEVGYCGQTAKIRAARAALHYWEEPCISGTADISGQNPTISGAAPRGGSGAVFFSGCNLKCIFCQNYPIAAGKTGKEISMERLSDIFLELQAQGAYNINLVTGTHFVPQICAALRLAKSHGLALPVVYNTGGYEKTETLQLLEGLVDIYLPDLKYYSSELSGRYSHAPDYFEKASAALAEMFRQVGKPVLEESSGLMKRGVIVRHLILPGETKDSKKLLRYLHETYRNDIYVSIMNQYTPLSPVSDIPSLNRRVTEEEYRRVLNFAERIGIEQGFRQEGETARESFIPEFDETGV
ncbi:MAG: radical SAM protein [Candidatus Gastranaerophilales bacterium]|nr:radical SAM protein [Candidatus Gastranaerophilales bacterium]